MFLCIWPFRSDSDPDLRVQKLHPNNWFAVSVCRWIVFTPPPIRGSDIFYWPWPNSNSAIYFYIYENVYYYNGSAGNTYVHLHGTNGIAQHLARHDMDVRNCVCAINAVLKAMLGEKLSRLRWIHILLANISSWPTTVCVCIQHTAQSNKRYGHGCWLASSGDDASAALRMQSLAVRRNHSERVVSRHSSRSLSLSLSERRAGGEMNVLGGKNTEILLIIEMFFVWKSKLTILHKRFNYLTRIPWHFCHGDIHLIPAYFYSGRQVNDFDRCDRRK